MSDMIQVELVKSDISSVSHNVRENLTGYPLLKKTFLISHKQSK